MPVLSNILGIDVGSVSVSVVESSPKKEVVRTVYEFHHGKITETLRKILTLFDLSGIGSIAATSSTPPVIKATRQYDNRVSIITACRHFYDRFGAILVVGGERFGLIRFDAHGNYLNFKANTSCAAGTGSFLDQQARRLGLSGIEELSEIALKNQGTIPKIASRCAVFAKTDLVHAQQEGYSLPEICDGLCFGLAENIVDTLFKEDKPNGPVIFIGGVSKNRAVANHIQSLTGLALIQHDHASVYGAIGAAFNLADDAQAPGRIQINSADDILISHTTSKKHYFDPLQLKLSDYPAFSNSESYEFTTHDLPVPYPVEVDIYHPPEPLNKIEAYLGIDIGSTSTKAVLINKDKTVLAGFYTRTAGRPVNAVLQVFAAIDHMIMQKKMDLHITGAATTGSGRKFTGKIVGADIVIDEITAHARAACELRPDVDTIIEIGGQDSKFTTVKNGMVTFSIMNTVCAAGTGSFIEEQAEKLECALSEYSARTENQKAPIASDRCTVFMERDINHYLSEGYAVDEVLASVLHAIRENYLTKVAIESSIGKTITFQGATAKNKALVAAFEQRLGKPIHVSPYCHLTGALGSALILWDQKVSKTGFRGIGLHKTQIPVRTEVCELCTNHCKITIADVGGENVAYGFLCGRDYDTRKYVNNNRSGFDLIKERQQAFSFSAPNDDPEEFTIGIPAALHLYEDLPFWKMFFSALSIKTVTSERHRDAIKEGKHIAGAEFCAPMAAFHGHVNYLTDKSDYIFIPFYLEKKTNTKSIRRQYCYYTQFSTPLAAAIGEKETRAKYLTPLISYMYTNFYTKVQLYRMLKPLSGRRISLLDVSAAYDKALEFKTASLIKLREIYKREASTDNNVHVVFLGRPYSILSPGMNKGIPNIFASMGIKTYFQDMVSFDNRDVEKIKPLTDEMPWYYAAQILEAAEIIAGTESAYPVFVTSFKCTPDAFVIDYFKKIMEAHDKPYLILQLDEHDSNVGYETRIEAAIRSFRNHFAGRHMPRPVTYPRALIPSRGKPLLDKTLVIPCWDSISQPLIVANLRREGFDARLMEETETSIQKSLRYNTGQCIPMHIIAQGFIDFVERHDLDPSKTALWIIDSEMACNLSMFYHHTRTLLDQYGNGMERAATYAGNISLADISLKLPVNTYFAYMFGGLLRKIGCQTRPYEKNKGQTDAVIEASLQIFLDAFSGNRSKEAAVAEVISRFETIATSPEQRPKVAIFGDLYVRDNEIMNQDLVYTIEANGGEVITTPYSFILKMIANQYFRKWFIEGKYLESLSSKALMIAVKRLEKTYWEHFGRILEPEPEYNTPPEKILSEYNMRIENTGESMDNIMKIHYLLKHYPDIALFVQTNPAFCCPSLVTEAMTRQIENNTQIPVVPITYDGTASNKNDVVIPYLKYPRKRSRAKRSRAKRTRASRLYQEQG